MGQVISQDKLILLRRGWKGNSQCVVFASGRFDLLHPGHVRLLERAHSHGDILVVGVQSDEAARREPNSGPSARSSSGDSGAIVPAAERAEIVASLAAVDYVTEYDEPTPASLISRLAPDIVVEGGSPMESAPPSPPGGGVAPEVSAPKLVRILLEPGFSTARIIERIQQFSA